MASDGHSQGLFWPIALVGSVLRGLARAVLALLLLVGAALAELPTGLSQQEIQLGETTLTVFTYKPEGYRDGPLVMVFHGSDRRPELARDNAIPLGNAAGAIVVAPLFDADRFSRWAYQFGGLGDLVDVEGRRKLRLRSPEEWTGQLVLALIEHLRREEGRADLPYYLIGHSAGAQFLGRFAAFVPNEARRIVLANPGNYVFPTRDRRFPYGFGSLPDAMSRDQVVRHYLGSPITILLATADRNRDGLDKSNGAERQGSTRYERGWNAFSEAQDISAERSWPFGWKIIEVPGLGHGSRKLYRRPEAAEALFGP